MARPIRIEYENAYYHVTSRGDNRRAIFIGERDNEEFYKILEDCWVKDIMNKIKKSLNVKTPFMLYALG